MQQRLTKRALFRGRFTQEDTIRPPGAVLDFISICDQCGDCAPACPVGMILTDSSGYPVADPASGPCQFCNACADACQTGAIRPATGWDIRAKVTSQCLSFNGVTCRTCEDQCDHQAIRFHLMQGGRSIPIFDLEACTGCGACAPACPAQSIQFYEHKQPCEEKPC